MSHQLGGVPALDDLMAGEDQPVCRDRLEPSPAELPVHGVVQLGVAGRCRHRVVYRVVNGEAATQTSPPSLPGANGVNSLQDSSSAIPKLPVDKARCGAYIALVNAGVTR